MKTPAKSSKYMTPEEIEAMVAPILLRPLPESAYVQLSAYLQLLSHWNQKINLTAVRDPKVLVKLHLAECLRAAQRIAPGVKTVLDFGSGAGFPGIPIQVVRPDVSVTLAESQVKKAAFLRETVRELSLGKASVHAGRVEDMPAYSVFDVVTLRAVDKMAEAIKAAISRVRPAGGAVMVLTSRSEVPAVMSATSSSENPETAENEWLPPDNVPGTDQRVILTGFRI